MEPDRYEMAIAAFVEAARDRIAATLAALVRIPTVNPYGGDAQARGEAEGQRRMEELMRAAGGTVERVPVPADVYARAGVLGPAGRHFGGRDNVVGRFAFGAGTGPVVLFNSHMDTVGADDFEGDPFSGRIEGDLVHGRGASDAKGGLVAGLFAVEALAGSGAPVNGRIVFESVVEEECSGAGAGTLACCLAGIGGRAAVVLDGAAGRILTGCQGITTAEVTVRGRAGHGAAGGVSAVDKILLVKAAADRLAAERAARYPGTAVNVGVLRAGVAPWVVANRGFLSANITYTHAEATDWMSGGGGFCGAPVRARFERLLDEAADADAWLRDRRPELTWTKDAPPYRLADCGSAEGAAGLLAAARRGMELAWGRAAEEVNDAPWVDASHLARIGRMPAVCLGAGEPGAAHGAVEFNRISNVQRTAVAAAVTAVRLMAA
jgi:acetylornithine deacetylase